MPRFMHYFFGSLVAIVLLCLSFGTLVATGMFASGIMIFDVNTTNLNFNDWAIIRFTVLQAAVSAFLSIFMAIFVARALARRHFIGRRLILSLLNVPFILPAIVAVFGLLALWGRSGIISHLLMIFDYERLNIYGYKGIIIAHVFFNLPLATRLIVQGWQAIPAEHFRLAAQLNFDRRSIHSILERPMLQSVIPGAFLLIFLLCITSFAVVLALGGGPQATTIELAIYQAIRFDFDLAKAAKLALIQFALCGCVTLLAVNSMKSTNFAVGLGRPIRRWDGKKLLDKIIDIIVLIIFSLFIFLPLLALIRSGLLALFSLPYAIIPAAITSLIIALCSASLALVLTLVLADLIVRLNKANPLKSLIESMGFLILANSPFVFATGFFIIINPYVNPFKFSLPIVIIINAVMSLPFCLRIILPPLIRAELFYGRLGDSLGMSAKDRFLICIWPRIRNACSFATGLSMALSSGDLGVIALFAPPDVQTLPLLMYRLMATYQLEAASGVAFILLILSLTLFCIFDREV